METSTLGRMAIYRLDRDHHSEDVLQLVEKVEYYLSACSAEEWALILAGRVEDKDTFIYNFEQNKVCLNIPASPFGNNDISPIAPRIEEYATSEFGSDNTNIITDNSNYPCLKIIESTQTNISKESIPYAQTAKQLASVLGISGTWDEPALKKNSFRWKTSKIEYQMHSRISNRILLEVKDYDGCTRNLIEIRQSPNLVLPLSLAQDAINFCVPMHCHFSFDASWYFQNSEYLAKFKSARVVITNELGVVLGNRPDKHTVVLGYAFGYEMIAYLKLEGLRYRDVILLVIETPKAAEFRKNLQEAIALLSRFRELDVKIEIAYAKCSYADGGTILRKCKVDQKEVELEFLTERYDDPITISRDELIKTAMEHGIFIPDNIRLDRLGLIPEHEQNSLITNLLDSGTTTAILSHDGVDTSLITGSLAAEMNGYTENVFYEHWKITGKCSPVIFTASGLQAGIEKAIAGLRAKPCPLYTFPSGTKVEIEQRLSAIRHETRANIFIFSGRQIFTEQKKLLEIAAVWMQKSGAGMLICGNVNTSTGTSDFLDEICWRKFHVLRQNNNDLTYLINEDDPFSENPHIFKMTLKCGMWSVGTLTENDKNTAMSSLLVRHDYGTRKIYQEDELEEQLKKMT